MSLDMVVISVDFLETVIENLKLEGLSGSDECLRHAEALENDIERQSYGIGESVPCVGRISRVELAAWQQLRQRILMGQNEKAMAALQKLAGWVPEYLPDEVMQSYEDNGAKKGQVPPFFCEVTLYELLGKGQARTLLALIGDLCEAFGTDLRSLLKRSSE